MIGYYSLHRAAVEIYRDKRDGRHFAMPPIATTRLGPQSVVTRQRELIENSADPVACRVPVTQRHFVQFALIL